MTLLEYLVNSLLFLLTIVSISLAPPEAILSTSQKIMYLKLGCIFSTYGMVLISFFATITYLIQKKIFWQAIVKEALELAFFLSTASIIMGSLWAKFAWNTFFSFEPRLLSFLVLWLILLAAFTAPKEGPRSIQFYSLISVLSVISIPIIKVSIEWLPEDYRLHPQIISKGGLESLSFRIPLIISTIFTFILSLTLLVKAVKAQMIYFKIRYG